MRIANSVVYGDFINNLNLNASTVQDTMHKLSSGKAVSKSSDDPLAAAKIMDYTKALAQNKTYGNTISDSQSWTQTQDSALSSVSTALTRIRSLIQSSANGTNSADEVQANKDEISASLSTMVDALNTSYGDRYVFAGQSTDTKPFSLTKDANGEITGLSYAGSNSNLTREISEGVNLDLATNGSQLMQPTNNGASTTTTNGTYTSASDLNDYIGKLMTNLNTVINNKATTIDSNGTTSQLTPDQAQNNFSNGLLADLDNFTNSIVNARTNIGAIENRLQASASLNTSQNLSLSQDKSDVQNVDVAQTYMQYQNQMTAYLSTLAMGTKIMQTTILDYLQ
ncbi:flagellar hook-associated protein 3 FlgL [Weissella beninensis]|uniref:Flagellar hook-associated protein FlgL n=1 Tax=Periweissella beninensis TaxID=504936 RepID=A0ABT0VGM2_9LACO|nr:flagellar hook-associated protein FlgL [Periweissella beninensis]MBM7544763.1 flagellar hook-associated protein 3 FlgL [Periweissella beninensis]MCM2436992.1 flagellar hook-associated protein FlgL [Periweissella beninensis]